MSSAFILLLTLSLFFLIIKVSPIKPIKSIDKFPYPIYPASLKHKVRLRNALRYSGKFKIIQVWADDKICDAHSDSLVLLWRHQWRDMTTQQAQGKEWTERSRVGLSSAGLGLWLNEATANWSTMMGRRHEKGHAYQAWRGQRGREVAGQLKGRQSQRRAGKGL